MTDLFFHEGTGLLIFNLNAVTATTASFTSPRGGNVVDGLPQAFNL